MSTRSPGVKTPDFIKQFATDQYAKKGSASFEQHPTGTQQLELFQHFRNTSPLHDADTPGNTSNLVEIYDLLPKGIAYGSVSTTPSTIEKVITIDGRSVILVLTPAAIARVVKGKKVIEFHYPTNKEDLISEVVRFIVLRKTRSGQLLVQRQVEARRTGTDIGHVVVDAGVFLEQRFQALDLIGSVAQ